MTGFILTIVAMLVLGLLLGALINPGIGLLAIPIVLFVVLNIVMVGDTLQRQRRIHRLRQFRGGVRAQKVVVTERDKHTLV
jgi:hypothetical protein